MNLDIYTIVFLVCVIVAAIVIINFSKKPKQTGIEKELMPNATEEEQTYGKIFVDAAMLGQKGEHASAVKKLEDALKVNDSDHIFYLERAKYFSELKKFDEAAKDAQKAIELIDGGKESLFSKIRYENNTEALNVIRKIEKSSALVLLSRINTKTGNFAKAVEYADMASENDEKINGFSEALLAKGEARLAAGEKENALNDFETYKSTMLQRLENIEDEAQKAQMTTLVQKELEKLQVKIDALRKV